MFVKKKKTITPTGFLKLKHCRNVYKNMFSIQTEHKYSTYVLY